MPQKVKINEYFAQDKLLMEGLHSNCMSVLHIEIVLTKVLSHLSDEMDPVSGTHYLESKYDDSFD